MCACLCVHITVCVAFQLLSYTIYNEITHPQVIMAHAQHGGQTSCVMKRTAKLYEKNDSQNTKQDLK